ncbi:MAG TPA: serine/threonine protein kinase [Verrucomicrobiae bacterium]
MPRLLRLVTQARPFLSRHLWIWPLLGALLLGLVGYWVRRQVDEATRSELAARLEAVLNANISALRLWFSQRESDLAALGADTQVTGAINYLAELATTPAGNPEALASSAAATTLQDYLKPFLKPQNYLDYIVLSAQKTVLAASGKEWIGVPAPRAYESVLEQALDGQISFSRPVPRAWQSDQTPAGPPVMLITAPIKSPSGKVAAVLALRVKPEEEFSKLFNVARMGETGESYAFDLRGYVLTATRFDRKLKALGLIPNTPGSTAISNLRLLDPEVNLDGGDRPVKPRTALRLTKLAAAAVMGDDGTDVHGYRNYRGVEVVGAWAWLPDYRMGVATEVATSEAFKTQNLLRQAFFVMFALLVLSGAAIFGFTLLFERLQASVRTGMVAVRQLGQYVLLQEIGRGATGMVYRARHAVLRRPVAIKLLSPEMTNEATAARFEHEVQITSQLTHPNTVAVYDYGRTPEGLFYYAMEYLTGINLDNLVRQFGPQPEGRVIHILRQVCGSLAEAHQVGLIHRDIKPANIVLTRRGGMCDVVKVLDFGLVKTRQPGPADKGLANAIVGTPHFISPEAVRDPAHVDARSDLYSVGAVGFWLLTGSTLFDSDNVKKLLEDQVNVPPAAPSERLGREVGGDLEALIIQCLAKAPEERPASARDLEQILGRCAQCADWGPDQAEDWWKTNLSGIEDMPLNTSAGKTLVIAPRP